MNTKNLQDPNAAIDNNDDDFDLDDDLDVNDDPFDDDSAFGDDDEDDGIQNDDDDINPDDDGENDDDGLNDDDDLDDAEGLDGEDDEQIVTLSDGMEVSFKDVEEAYTQRTELVAQQDALKEDRATVNEYAGQLKDRNSQLETQVNNLTQFLATVIPAEPDRSLIQTDPARFMEQQEHRKAVLAELGQVMAIKEAVNNQTQAASADDAAREATAENALLVKALPNLRDEKRLAAFNTEIAKTAKDLGFTEEEAANIPDHRMKLTLHYAAMGKKAAHNRKNAARRVTKAKAKRPNSTRRGNSGIGVNIDKARQAYRKNGSAVAAEALAMAAFSED